MQYVTSIDSNANCVLRLTETYDDMGEGRFSKHLQGERVRRFLGIVRRDMSGSCLFSANLRFDI